MDKKLQDNWNALAIRLRQLPQSWPPDLVFMTPPNIDSPAYSRPVNPLQPNHGPCCLSNDNQDNREFLEIQLSVARNLELCQNFETETTLKILHDLRGIEDELEKVKMACWEKARRVRHSGTYYL